MPYTNDDALAGRNPGNPSAGAGEPGPAVQKETVQSGAGHAVNPASVRKVLDRPYVDVHRAARELGVPVAAVIADIEAESFGKVGNLHGGPWGSVWLVPSWCLQEPHLSRHRERPRAASMGSAAP